MARQHRKNHGKNAPRSVDVRGHLGVHPRDFYVDMGHAAGPEVSAPSTRLTYSSQPRLRLGREPLAVVYLETRLTENRMRFFISRHGMPGERLVPFGRAGAVRFCSV